MADAVVFEDEISPWLRDLVKNLSSTEPATVVSEKMVTLVREAHMGGRGLADGKPYAPLSPKYAERKAAVGGSPKVLFGPSPGRIGEGGGGLFSSWRVLNLTPKEVIVGAGTERGSRLASAHDGGLAEKLGKPNLNRLRIGWNSRSFEEICRMFMAKVFGK